MAEQTSERPMFEPTEADIGRRVVYDARPVLKHLSHGSIAALNVISNLVWDDKGANRG